jgi:Zn-dependent protease
MDSNFTITSGAPRNCKRCGHELAPDALECAQCQALVHGEALERLAGEAKMLEAQGDLLAARDRWLAALPLLPEASAQGKWVRERVHTLEESAAALAGREKKKNWAGKLAPLGGIGLILAKILKLKFLFSLVAFMGFYWALWGAKFGIGFAVLILIHEMGHFIDVKRRGLPAEMPVFLPGFGAYVKWQALGVSQETRAAVSLAGPLAGWFAAATCAMLFYRTGDRLWAALAWSGAWLNVLNLIPVWVLDGAQAVLALSKYERLIVLATSLAIWFAVGQTVFLLVAAGAAWRLFTKDAPPRSGPAITAYFVAVLAGLAVVMWLMPQEGFGRH